MSVNLPWEVGAQGEGINLEAERTQIVPQHLKLGLHQSSNTKTAAHRANRKEAILERQEIDPWCRCGSIACCSTLQNQI